MTAGARIANRYRGTSSDRLRRALKGIRNPRCKAAIRIVLTERADANQAGFDAAQLVLDATGGAEAQGMHEAALDTAKRLADAGRHREAESAQGVADALWDYIRERSDT